ncbi:MAG: hypothetical protein H8E66_30880 [Planctomycetes bacterium]|nr:hypothetical protein [Planctomycetota bacterium]
MTVDLYRYQFDETVSTEDVESALLLAVWGCEALHGETQTRLDAAHYFDPATLACVVDARTPVGRDLNRLFVGFISREIGMDAFTIERVPQEAA